MSKVIVIGGIPRSGSTIMFNMVKEILKQMGQTVYQSQGPTELMYNPKPEEDEAFHIVHCHEFKKEIEMKADIVFTSRRNPFEILPSWKACFPDDPADTERLIKWQYDLIKWTTSPKHAYCMDFNHEDHKVGLYHYNTLKSIILPLKFAYPTLEEASKKLNSLNLITALQKIVPPTDKDYDEETFLFKNHRSEKS